MQLEHYFKKYGFALISIAFIILSMFTFYFGYSVASCDAPRA
jgi:hypothetical protein